MQFKQALDTDFEVPDPNDPNIDEIYAADESSIYCNKRIAAANFKGEMRSKLKTAVAALCPLYPENDTPHDYFAKLAEEEEEENDAIINLRKWTAGTLPLRIIQAVQAALYTVSNAFSSLCVAMKALCCFASYWCAMP